MLPLQCQDRICSTLISSYHEEQRLRDVVMPGCSARMAWVEWALQAAAALAYLQSLVVAALHKVGAVRELKVAVFGDIHGPPLKLQVFGVNVRV